MAYMIEGKFFEACDCEIICSCWNEVEPVMGQCTGMFVWSIDKPSMAGGIDVTNCKLATISQGVSCDDAEKMLVVIAPDPAMRAAKRQEQRQALANAFFDSTGPWNQVFDFPTAGKGLIEVQQGKITFEDKGSGRIKVRVKIASKTPLRSVEASAFADFSTGIKLDGSSSPNRPDGRGVLVKRVPGGEPPIVEAGKIQLNRSVGLSLLGDLYHQASGQEFTPAGALMPNYRFDIDLTTVTAMRGNFSYNLQ